jgi:hypothetical protein
MVCYFSLRYLLVLMAVVGCDYFNLKQCFYYSNNMLYPKEDKENKVLLYAVSVLYKIVEMYYFLPWHF